MSKSWRQRLSAEVDVTRQALARRRETEAQRQADAARRLGPFCLNAATISRGGEEYSLHGVRASVTETGVITATTRHTITRSLTGVGYFFPKPLHVDHRQQWLTIEGPGFSWTHLVGGPSGVRARQFAAWVNDLAAKQLPPPR